MAIVTRNEGAKINSTINVTPMVDVMLAGRVGEVGRGRRCK
jgi:biopolymer transport protein ExbD